MKNKIIALLKKNGFEKQDTNIYANGSYSVTVCDDEVWIVDNLGNAIAHNGWMDWSTYCWLIGCMVAHRLIDRSVRL